MKETMRIGANREEGTGAGTITVSQIVRNDYRTADVFKKWGINYCCGGNLPLNEACALRNIDPEKLKEELQKATQNIFFPGFTAFAEWPLSFLTDYIIHVHHGYSRRVLPALTSFLAGYVPGHLKKFPHLEAVQQAFLQLADDLHEHMDNEEESIFPYVKQIINTCNRREVYGPLFVRTMSRPLADTVQREHGRILARLGQLREVTGNYTFAPDACTNYQVLYHKLSELDTDLVQHKNLENNFLFPKAIEMEKSLLQV